ncbi:MAG: CPCC family cysteine-rich protein [Verrucomicrobiae bacterium]|nr:CPCC family cysteine-rich protein [Verrucomicrobiae bacterium]
MAFTNIIKPPASDGSLYPCPCCGERMLPERGGYDICGTCGWEDDGQDEHDADEVRGGPNGSYSLTQARQAFREQRAREREWR